MSHRRSEIQLWICLALLLAGMAGCSKPDADTGLSAKVEPASPAVPPKAPGASDPKVGQPETPKPKKGDTAKGDTAKEDTAKEDAKGPQAKEREVPSEPDPKDPTETKADSKAGEAANETEKQDETAKGLEAADDGNPFAHRAAMPELPAKAEWINSKPLTMKDLRGKFVLFDFWTYCCINCMHVLPELKKLEHAYPKNLVVIGVHSAKFETEKDADNIAQAVLRHEIEHPVLVDSDHKFWNTIGVRSWPTVLLVDPEGKAVWGRPGEVKFEDVEEILKIGLPHYREKKLLDETPIRFDLLANKQKKTPLRFPGKVLADEASKRLFITDSGHNRIVITNLEGKLLETIGAGSIGREDGGFDKATFDHPQGVALHGDTLYVADTENHMIRKVDLKAKIVKTIAGDGKQARSAFPGLEKLAPGDDFPERWVGKPSETGINSPWALLVHEDLLYIAMAGPHQIWTMKLDESEIGPFAGNGREDIVDGPLMPKEPYAQGASSFAQPSGLTSDGEWLYVADSEGSSVRAVPFDVKKQVRTVVGSAHLPFGRLFEFGDVDGDSKTARLQHVLGVTHHEGQIYITDTYNNKIKAVDAKTGTVRTIAGEAESGATDDPGLFHEPAGISHAGGQLFVADTNNHLIRVVNPADGKVRTLKIDGLTPPKQAKTPKKPDFSLAIAEKVPPTQIQVIDGKIKLSVSLKLPEGWKINELAPMRCWLESDGGVLDLSTARAEPIEPPKAAFELSLPAKPSGEDKLIVSLPYFYCQSGGDGLCKIGSVEWTVPITVSKDGKPAINLTHDVNSGQP